jgi:hypothetical protein
MVGRSKVALLLMVLAGCEASFTDLRPSGLGEGPSPDAGFFDVGPPPIADRVLLEGTFGGRGRYTGRGGASIVQRMDGSLELALGDDFSVSSVPGPVLVLTTRASIGNQIQEGQGDLDLGPLDRNSGAQTYPVPNAALGAIYLWVFCRPFGVEIARAELVEVSP